MLDNTFSFGPVDRFCLISLIMLLKEKFVYMHVCMCVCVCVCVCLCVSVIRSN
jgi:hypothetical protein